MCAVKMCQNFPALCVDFVDTIANLLQSNAGKLAAAIFGGSQMIDQFVYHFNYFKSLDV